MSGAHRNNFKNISTAGEKAIWADMVNRVAFHRIAAKACPTGADLVTVDIPPAYVAKVTGGINDNLRAAIGQEGDFSSMPAVRFPPVNGMSNQRQPQLLAS